MQPSYLHPTRLPFGTRVGPWRVLERLGLGSFGAVYRAIGAEAPSCFVALKLALHPNDPRFARERELLSRLRHPHVPRFLDHGQWQLGGLCFPYLAMELIDGVSLYAWARESPPTSRQVLHVLSCLARALAATHAAGGLHRDVKGDNTLLRDSDGHVFLTDFGSGHFLGAAPLTPHPFPPSTPHYRSPEAWRSLQPPLPLPLLPYAPGPADDVFALGVTSFRLVTDQYPFSPDLAFRSPPDAEAPPPSARALNSRCYEALSDLTSRMLSPSPEARGTARELAEALEQAAREAGPEADMPLFAPEVAEPGEVRASPQHVPRRAPRRSRRPWLTGASLGGALALGAAWLLSAHPGEQAAQAQASASEETEDGGTVAVGDAVLTAPVPATRAPSAGSPIAVDLPPKPLPGQRRPDASGRCPFEPQVAINGGCWIRLPVKLKDCEAEGYGYIYKGGCYLPALPNARPPTSSPAERTDAPQ